MPQHSKQERVIVLALSLFLAVGAIFMIIGGAMFFSGAFEDGFINMIFPGLGLICFLIGLIPLLLTRHKKTTNRKLRENGRRIIADIIGMERGMISVGGGAGFSHSSPGQRDYDETAFHIVCQWNDGGKAYLFRSGAIWTNPEMFLNQRNITKLPVYIDKNDMKKYYVDIDCISENIVDLR